MNYLIVLFCLYVSLFSGYCEDKQSKKNDDGDLDPANFKPNPKKEYTVVKESKNWYGASLGCRRRGLMLASVESEAEQQQLASYLNKTTAAGLVYWLGGSELETQDGRYSWLSTGLPVCYTTWSPGQPDKGFKDGHVEHCLALSGSFKQNFTRNWHNYDCYSTLYYICQNVHCKN